MVSRREKKKIQGDSKELPFELFDETEEDNLPQRLDKGLLLLRQVDRVFRYGAGDTISFINSVELLACALYPEVDEKFNKVYEKEEKAYLDAKESLTEGESNRRINIDIEFYRQKYKLLMELMKRKGMW